MLRHTHIVRVDIPVRRSRRGDRVLRRAKRSAFRSVVDTPFGDGKRWVEVAPAPRVAPPVALTEPAEVLEAQDE